MLIAVILVVFNIVNAPSAEEQKRMAEQRDSIARVEQERKDAELLRNSKKDTLQQATPVLTAADSLIMSGDSTLQNDSLIAVLDSIKQSQANQELANQYGVFARAAQGEDQYYSIENEKIRITLNAHGGKIAAVDLKKYESYRDYMRKDEFVPLRLFDEDSSSFDFSFFMNDVDVHTADLYAVTSAPVKQEIAGSDSAAVTFRFNTNNTNKYIDITYSLKGDSYLMDLNVNVHGLEKEKVASTLSFNWDAKMYASEKLLSTERMVSSVFYQYNGEGRTYLSETSEDRQPLLQKTDWIAFKQSYFSAAVMSKNGIDYNGSEIAITPVNSDRYIKEYYARVYVGGNDAENFNAPLSFYFGPNDYKELAKIGNGMEGIVNLGWGIFRWVNKWLVIPIFNLLEGLGMGYGWIILLLTIVVKIIIMPLTYRNYKSSAKMRVLKPEIEELTAKFKDDPMKKQQETMALYRRSGVNPMAGCIPMLIQMPVLIAVFRFFPSAIQLRQQSFLWAEDLSGYDSIANLGFSIPAYGDHVSLFTLLMCVSTIFITKMNSGQMDNGMPGMKFMMYFFPVMMIFFFNNFASGLTYYYFISNLLSLIIMWAIKKYFIDEKRILAQIHENRKNPKSQKKSAFMQRLEDAAKQQQQNKQQGKKK